MNRKIIRNIAIVSAVFVVTFSIMLITNYFQVKGVNPLQTEVIETLKQINDENANNVELQEQIRQLDLLARRAYFVRMDHLMMGVYILIGMLAVLLVSLHLYFSDSKNIPDKKIDPVDDWLVKTNARRYVNWSVGVLVVATLVFVGLSSPYFKDLGDSGDAGDIREEAVIEDESIEAEEAPIAEPQEELIAAAEEEPAAVDTIATVKEEPVAAVVDTIAAETEDIPKVTHNGFRGNNSNAISTAKSIPTKWDLSTGENIAWTNKISRQGYNSPVINGNKVFITGADEEAREMYCYHLKTGELLWTVKADNIPGSPAQMPKTTDDTGLAASTVATNGKQVCAVFASGDLICADMDGKRLWAKNLGVPTNHYGYASSLLTFGNSLIVQYDNSNAPKVVALDMATGKERWNKTRTDKITWSSPIIAYIDKKPQLVLMGNPGITAYNPSNGEQYWRVEGMMGEVAASPCSAADIVFGASENATMIAINATTGEKRWEADDFLPEVSSPVATKDHVYLATSYGVLACYDSKTGELKQSHELNTEFYSSPVITEGKLYVFSNDGKMFIYTANNDFKLINSFETGEKTFATPAFTDGMIVVRTEKSIYCVAAKKKA